LISLITHSGNSDGGHYFNVSKRGKNWYLFDDNFVKKIDEKEIHKFEAYMLFYRLIENKK